ncbi:MAG: IS1595 family transposase [Flavobacteriales bacterium]|nr:IS1595 family transposase [Flavobacteriales bacterium]
MKKYGLQSHDSRFNTEEKCREFLIQQRWDGRPTCNKCGNNHLNYFLTSRNVWKCSKCRKQFSLTKGTIFESSKLPLTKWFKAIFYFTTAKRGISSCQLARWLEIEQKTAWFVLQRIREALEHSRERVLSGIVEVDETYISPDPGKDKRVQRAKHRHEKDQDEKFGFSSKRKTTMRKQIKKEPDSERKLKEFNEWQLRLSKNGKRKPFNPAIAVLGMYQRNGDVLLFHIGRQYLDTTKRKIAPYLLKHISEDSELVTDESSFYTEVGQKFLRHKVVHHDLSYVSDDGIHTNNIENVWMHLKKMVAGTYFHMSFWHYYRYLNEHAFRWNIRNLNLKEGFDELINKVFGHRITYKDLIISKQLAACSLKRMSIFRKT